MSDDDAQQLTHQLVMGLVSSIRETNKSIKNGQQKMIDDLLEAGANVLEEYMALRQRVFGYASTTPDMYHLSCLIDIYRTPEGADHE